VLRAKGIVPTTEGPHELQYGTHYCSLSPSETNDYSLVVIGTDFNVPMVHNEVCQS
jgi:cobalamin synthesis protein P47K